MMTRPLLRWPVDAAAICGRIVGTRADLKIVLKTRNERELIEKWILHHLPIAGPGGLVIFDNGSTDPEVLAVYARYGDAVQIFGWDLNHNRIHNATLLKSLYQALRASCRYYAFLDTDEFAFWTDGERLQADGLVARLATHETGLVYPGMWWEHHPVVSGTYAPKVDLAWGKPLMSAAVDLEGRINHNVQLVQGNPGLRLRGGFVVCHHVLEDAARRIRSNVDKCVAYGWVANVADIDAIIAAGRVEELPGNFRVWVRQIARLRSGEPRPVGRLGPKAVAVEPDGRLRFGSAELGQAVREFAASAVLPAEAIGAGPTSGPPESGPTSPENP